MAGHSHWAGIKHKKGKADKQRSKIFSKLSKEITVAAKLGDRNPELNSRLRSAIQAARAANMPKENIQKAIENMHESRTIIVIAHRLSTVSAADKIFVLDSGKIVEFGTKNELIREGGVFSNLWATQHG